MTAYTTQLSSMLRKFAFAGAAICWFFRTRAETFPLLILLALLFIVLAFGFDILQYYIGAWVHRSWIQKQEAKKLAATGSIEGHYDRPRWIDWPAFCFFNCKVIAVCISFLLIGMEVGKRAFLND